MKLLLKLNIILVVILITNPINLICQKGNNPLFPIELPKKNYFGAFIGMGGNSQTGMFKTSCNCEFTDGTGFGVKFGLLFERDLSEYFEFGALLGYNMLNISSSYQEIEPITVYSNALADSVRAAVRFRQQSDVSLGSIFLQPYFKFTLNPFFIRFGASAEYLINADLTNTKELLQKSVLLPTGEPASIDIDKTANPKIRIEGDKAILEEGKLPGVNSIQFYLQPALGANFALSD
ncbi:MAG: hypothetical protein QG635_1434, partial [Bacteroidota bacterium]|nr:hypothetical protein [Bacteroidota bacterium]